VGPDFLTTLLRQTVCILVILLKTALAEHQYSAAARIETLETFLRKQLLVNAGVVLLTAVCFGQRARFDVVARTDAGYPVLWLGMIVVLLGTWHTVNRRGLGMLAMLGARRTIYRFAVDVLAMLGARGAVDRYGVGILACYSLLAGFFAFVVVVNQLADNCYPQHARGNAGQISFLAARNGGADRRGGHGYRTGDDYCYESTVHSLFLS
tara:strand:+ start:231 stop:857 length:627 start_codon:yes stop_codon:yes gene_type:complete